MVYKPLIPAATDKPSQSQAEIQENFTQLNTQFGNDHVAFDAASNNGKHQKVTLPQAGAPTTGANEAAIYTKSATTTVLPVATPLTQPEAFFRQQSNGTEYQLTKGNPNQVAGEGVCIGGLQIRVGTGTCPAGSPGTAAVAYSERFSTATIVTVVTPNAANSIMQTDTALYSASGFTVKSNGGGGFTYIAIGY